MGEAEAMDKAHGWWLGVGGGGKLPILVVSSMEMGSMEHFNTCHPTRIVKTSD